MEESCNVCVEVPGTTLVTLTWKEVIFGREDSIFL